MNSVIRLGAVLMFLACGVTAQAANLVTLNIYNDIGNKDLWLYLQYANNSQAVNVSSALPNGKYVQPWQSGQLPLNSPLTFTFSNIDGGKLYFGLMGPNSKQFLTNNAAPPTNSDAFFGFVEFAYLKTDPHVTWDISNVDQLAMLCGMKCSDPSPPTNPAFTKCGYAALSQPLMLQGLLQACNLPANTSTNVAYLQCGPSLQYRKLASPSIAPAAYQKIMNDYLAQLAQNTVTVKLFSDDLRSIGGPASVTFTGKFQTPKINSAISTTNPVVLTLVGNDTAKTTIYLTTIALNGQTIFRSDSDGGMYIYQNGQPVAGAQNVHLNYSSPSPGYFGKEISSVVRNLLTAMNLGEIAYTKNATYDQSNSSTWVPAYSGKYSNTFNKFIVNSSNSYGMPYSDAAHSKVQYFSSGNATLQLHALAPNDSSTYTYYDGKISSNSEFLRELPYWVVSQFLGGLPFAIPINGN